MLAVPIVSAAADDTRIADAAMRGQTTTVLALLKQGVNPNAPQGDGSTALHWAAYHGNLEMMQALLKAGADVKSATRIGSMTPIYMAAQNGNAPVIDLLLKAGANANEANANGTTLLMIASAAGNPEAVRTLLDHGADPNAKDHTNGQTALMFAAAVNSASAIKVLLAHDANPSITTNVVEVVQTQSKVDLRQQERDGAAKRKLDVPVVGGMTALHFATREGHMEAVRELLAGGADVDLTSKTDNTSPMTEAIINGHLDLAKFLLDHGADAKAANDGGLTPLYATIDIRWRANAWYPQPNVSEEKIDYLDFMKDLLDHGANVNARISKKLWFRAFRYSGDWVDPNGATAFWRAAQANDVAAMRFLIAHGADSNISTVNKVTPLMVAAGMGFEYQVTNIVPNSRMEAVRYLVEELGADVNAKADHDYTTLHAAAYVGDNAVIQYLVAKGANVKARAKGHLIGTGGAEDAPEGKGDTVADMANGPREKSLLHPETVKLLENLGSENSHDCRSTACVNNTKAEKPATKP
jgi:ankyrin repeat protein